MPQLSEWLQIMLGEIARKQDEVQRAAEELGRRKDEVVEPPRPAPQYLSTQSGRPSPQSG